jgi:uncharacterized protein involved in exopolysaccharide biosynthesis
MNPSSEPDISPTAIARALYRHRTKVILLFLLFFGAFAAVVLSAKPMYRYEAKLFLRLGRDSVLLDPTVTALQTQTLSMPTTRENELNSTVDLLTSRMLLERLVDELNPDSILGKAPSNQGEAVRASQSAGSDWLKSQLELLSKPTREKAIEFVESRLDVSAVKNSNVIGLSFEHPSAETTRLVVQKLIELYMKEHLRINRAPGAYDFLLKQTAAVQEQLAKTEAEWRDLKNESGVANVTEAKRLMIESLDDLEDDLRIAQVELSASKGRLSLLQEKLQRIPEMRETSRADGQLAAGADSIRGLLYALELKEKELSAKYTEQHHLVKEVRKQVNDSRDLLAREVENRRESTTSTNKVFEETELLLVKEESEVESFQARISALTKQISETKCDLQKLNDIELRFVQLERDTRLHDSNYKRYSESLEQARIDQELDLQRISNINVVQPDRAPDRPVDSKLMIKLAGGFLASCLASCLIAIGLERMRPPSDPKNQ